MTLSITQAWGQMTISITQAWGQMTISITQAWGQMTISITQAGVHLCQFGYNEALINILYCGSIII